jgi:hypothetical protein
VFILVAMAASPLACLQINDEPKRPSDTNVRIAGKSIVHVKGRGDATSTQAAPQTQSGTNVKFGGKSALTVEH